MIIVLFETTNLDKLVLCTGLFVLLVAFGVRERVGKIEN